MKPMRKKPNPYRHLALALAEGKAIQMRGVKGYRVLAGLHREESLFSLTKRIQGQT